MRALFPHRRLPAALLAGSAALLAGGTGAAAVTGAAAGVPLAAAAAAAGPVALPSPLLKVADAVPSVTPPTDAHCERYYHIACYGATQFEDAFNLEPLYKEGLTGKGETIAIVDSFGSPTVVHDLHVFDATYHLPNPKVTIIQPAGKVHFDYSNSTETGWAGETELDVEYSHAIAPGANILLVETPVAETEGVTGFPAIVKAEEYVISHHLAGVISQSFGASERTFKDAAQLDQLRGAYKLADEDGVTMLAAAGDSGADDVCNLSATLYCLTRTQSWPSSDPLGTSIGGLQLFLDGSRTLKPPAVWNDTALEGQPEAGGGGLSKFFTRPAYQDSVTSVVGTHRGAPDISMSAAVNGSALVYYSANVNGPGTPAGFEPVGGTSEATPEFAGIVAIADQIHGGPIGLINPALYALAQQPGSTSGLVDVVKGNNTITFSQSGHTYTVKGYDATTGYDLASGVGTVNAAVFIPALVADLFPKQ